MVWVSFSVNVNGCLSVPFFASNGLHQGDLIAPLLFVLAMEAFSRLVDWAIEEGAILPIRCGPVEVSHVLFADDLMIFGAASVANARGIWKVLHLFSRVSGLRVNFRKSGYFWWCFG